MTRFSLKDKPNISAGDRFAYLFASGFGAGFFPVGPGTVGSLEAVAIFLALAALRLDHSRFVFAMIILIVTSFAAGVWAAERTCKMTGRDDAQVIVIDEVSGQLIALAPLAVWPSFQITMVVIAFVLFRLFDIWKPYPIRKLERLHGGLGVMADDTLAGVYAAALLWLARTIHIV
ncbi:MAG TPA: phosphatidylglycerophosphatase A [Blastocatellia bacterium]|nr:phosphatidylglycerophosphatase A [Blastocatellia bacterium]